MTVAKEVLFWASLCVLAAAAIAWVFAGEIARWWNGVMDDRRCRFGG